MAAEQIKCPNCGANIPIRGLVLKCDYCNTDLNNSSQYESEVEKDMYQPTAKFVADPIQYEMLPDPAPAKNLKMWSGGCVVTFIIVGIAATLANTNKTFDAIGPVLVIVWLVAFVGMVVSFIIWLIKKVL